MLTCNEVSPDTVTDVETKKWGPAVRPLAARQRAGDAGFGDDKMSGRECLLSCSLQCASWCKDPSSRQSEKTSKTVDVKTRKPANPSFLPLTIEQGHGFKSGPLITQSLENMIHVITGTVVKVLRVQNAVRAADSMDKMWESWCFAWAIVG